QDLRAERDGLRYTTGSGVVKADGPHFGQAGGPYRNQLAGFQQARVDVRPSPQIGLGLRAGSPAGLHPVAMQVVRPHPLVQLLEVRVRAAHWASAAGPWNSSR